MFRLMLAAMLGLCVLSGCNDSSSSSSSPSTAQPPIPPAPPITPEADPTGIPAGAPEAARKPLASLPAPSTAMWPFANGIPEISGTGRFLDGAYYWTDFIYDAYGAFGQNPSPQNAQTPNSGSLSYPRVAPGDASFPGSSMDNADYRLANDPYQGNGADIFALAIGVDDEFSYWRVDWVTLVNANAPIIAFALDTDNNSSTGTDGQFSQGWTDIPNIRTAGVDRILMISAAGVYLSDTAGNRARLADALIDTNSHSFIARIPLAAIDPGLSTKPTIKMYALSGLHDGNGGFFTDMSSLGGNATTPPVYNAGFRDYADESPLENNFWLSNQQAQSLAAGDVASFALELDLARLGDNEPEPEVPGFSARWYVSSLGPDYFGRQGIYTGNNAAIYQTAQTSNDPLSYAGYYDRVQPYTLWIPTGYDPVEPEPAIMTLMLHSFTQNHMQYRATMPNFQHETCETLRQSFCLTVLGRGFSGFYEFASGVDLWEAWHSVSNRYLLDSNRTFTAGFSMGALGSQRLMIKHPDVFAAGVIIAGAQSDEPGVADQNGNVPGCFGELQLENLKWNGYYHAAGRLDQLVPFPQQRDTVDRFNKLGYRYTFDDYTNEDHVGWSIKDGFFPAFAEATDWLIGASSAQDKAPTQHHGIPGEIIYRFTGNDTPSEPEFSLDATGAWWISGLSIADDELPVQGYEPGPSQTGNECTFTNLFFNTTISPKAGRVYAVSHALPERPVTGLISPAPLPDTVNPQVRPDQDSSARIQATGPHVHEYQAWVLGDAPAATGLLSLELQNVGKITVDLAQAGISLREDKRLEVITDHDVRLTLKGLRPGTLVELYSKRYTVTSDSLVLELLASHSVPVILTFP